MVNKLCPNCGKSFTVSNQNKNQEYCNNKCKTELNNKRKTKQCEYCHKDFVAKSLGKNRFCSRECSYESMKIHDDYNCKNCGKQVKYKSNQSNIYCSKKCYSEYTQDQNKLKPINMKLYSNVYFINCKQCNNLFTSQKQNYCYCSSKCSNNFSYYNSKPIYKRECNVCNKIFQTKFKTQNQCSNDCIDIFKKQKNKELNRKHRQCRKHTGRAKKFNVKYESGISINKLLKRDGTKCLICGKEVLKKNMSGYHKDNATIGHIISLSNGGNHSMNNIQLECMECNVKKGNRDTI